MSRCSSCFLSQRITYVPLDMDAAGTNIAYLGILSVCYLVLGILIDYLNANPWLRNKLVHGARRAFTSKDAVVRALCSTCSRHKCAVSLTVTAGLLLDCCTRTTCRLQLVYKTSPRPHLLTSRLTIAPVADHRLCR